MKWNIEIGFEGIIWICLVQDRDKRQAHVSIAMNLQVP
jgi:hypothetical protein